MLQYNTIDVSEEIGVNKTTTSQECVICHYWYFLEINFRLQPDICDGCHDLMQKPINFHNAATVSVEGNDYRIHFWYISKGEAINLLKNADLIKNRGRL